jgi:hypothetical protein
VINPNGASGNSASAFAPPELADILPASSVEQVALQAVHMERFI